MQRLPVYYFPSQVHLLSINPLQSLFLAQQQSTDIVADILKLDLAKYLSIYTPTINDCYEDFTNGIIKLSAFSKTILRKQLLIDISKP